MRPVVANYSGGVCSFLAAKRAVERFGPENVTLLFADTREEDEDLYRFLREGAVFLGARLVEIQADYTMDELIDKYDAIPNSRMGFCTRELKREVADAWIAAEAPDALRVFGMDWTEGHRRISLEEQFGKENVWCPMMDRPLLLKPMMFDAVRDLGIAIPRMYDEGFQHNNCGGGCVKAGQASWAHLLRTRPERYALWEAREERVSISRGKPCSVLTDRRGDNKKKPLLLRDFRQLVQANAFDLYDYGGCGCFVEAPTPPEIQPTEQASAKNEASPVEERE